MKVVKFFLKPDWEKTAQRMCLSEHPFGTIKRAMGVGYFLLKGIRKVAGGCAVLSGMQSGTGEKSAWFWKNDGTDDGGISLFLQNGVFYSVFNGTEMKKGLILCLKIKF